LFHQPIAAMIKGDGYKTTVGDLLIRALTTSDNTANDRLLRYVGGPDAVRETIQRKHLGNIRFGPGERVLQSQTAGLEWKPQYAFGNSFTR
ncbi:serine hydrolase, partial [Vibrio parahaemolyticus]